MNTWFYYVGTVKNISSKEYTNRDWEVKKQFSIFITYDWWKININSSSEPLNIDIWNKYIFPVGVRPFKFTDKNTGELKIALNVYLRNEKIEQIK